MRSKLFVPGSRPELFSKALRSQADAISIDLEDSVVESRKGEARALVRDFLQSAEVRATKKVIIVRVNAMGTPHFEADVAAALQSTLTLLNLPKLESPADVHAAISIIERAEAVNGIVRPAKILANIETPKALLCAAEIASADERVAGLQLGLGDLFGSMGIERRNERNVHAAMFATVMAAGAAGIFAFDGAFADVQDRDGYRAEAEMACDLGFLGKSCIHPSQIMLANEVFSPSEEEVAAARRLLDAFHAANRNGVGALMVDGKMADIPFVRRAERIVSAAHTIPNEPK